MKTFIQKIVLITIVLLTTSVSLSQKNQIEKGNKEFDKYSFIDAREIYLKVIEDGYESAEIYKKLGDTYYFNGDYDNASKWYTKLIDKYPGLTEPVYLYRGAQSLKSIYKYEESDELMIAYAALGGEGLIVKHFESNPEYLKNIAFQSKAYEIEKVSINTKYSDFGPSFYNNKIVFASNSNATEGSTNSVWNDLPFLDLFEADVDDKGLLSNVTKMNGDINTNYHESSTAFTKDGTTVYFTRNNFINGRKGKDKNKTIRLKLYRSTLSGENYWTDTVELPFNNEEYSVAHPALSLDQKRLYFSSDMPGTIGESDLWYVDILGGNTYSDPVNLGPSINTEARETFPFISDMNNMYFSSDGRSGLGGLDVFVTPLDENGKSSVITNLGEPANSNLDDFGFIINETKRIGYLSSNRDGNGGSVDDEIYRVQECKLLLIGTVTNADTKEVIEGATVELLDENNKSLESVVSGTDGRYEFTSALECGKVYIIRASSTGCEFNEKVIETPLAESKLYEVPMALDCDPCPPNDLGCRLGLQPIYFDFDRFNIRPDAEIELAKILAAMRQYTEIIIHIESHTDSRAPQKYNELLSGKRAQSTLNWLVDQGIDRARLSAKGYGESQLVNQCADKVECTEEEHQLNRRSMFIIQN
ncbi:MAG: outer membrane protein OmpA-like peptidoglycan-associated protein [Flavobacteriaceae bacterium]|jgi:outer membrane protein OmpA-like peptidoglycan-associated protein/tetratricopeptide (TPR) repeat protein|uniref:OmpA family protein n=1 Tax=Candidatus Marifrigoribacter sp. Uisw_064 TaxID=3230970 RepID=UPI003AE8811C